MIIGNEPILLKGKVHESRNSLQLLNIGYLEEFEYA